MATEKTERTTIRWTPENLQMMKQRAEKAGVSTGRYVREVALGELPQDEDGADKYALIVELKNLRKELGAIGNNINQIAKLGNQTGAFDRERYGADRRAIYQMRMNINKAITELL
jgi:hypothetical protein